MRTPVPRHQQLLTVRLGTAWHNVNPVATGRPTLETATTVACSSLPQPGTPWAASRTRPPQTKQLVNSRLPLLPSSKPSQAGASGQPAQHPWDCAKHHIILSTEQHFRLGTRVEFPDQSV